MKVAIEKAGRKKVRLTWTDAAGTEATTELTEQQVESLHQLCVSAIKSQAFSMSVEVTVEVSRG